MDKLSISLLLSKSVVFSSLIGTIFIYYGDILLNKYNLENKYPKLANIIKLRRKFSKYYLLVFCLLVFGCFASNTSVYYKCFYLSYYEYRFLINPPLAKQPCLWLLRASSSALPPYGSLP
jgi:hypothetical protein